MYISETDIIPYHAASLPVANVVLVFAPHPDDEIFGCGGVIALHHLAGHPVHVVLLTAGDSQPSQKHDPAYGMQRLIESAQAAAVLGLPAPICWKLPDRSLVYGEELISRVLETIETLQADVVYSPSLWEAHPDHRAASMAVLEAMRRLGGQRTLCQYEVSALARPNQLLDVSSVWELKTQAMACFTSQNSRMDYPGFIDALNHYRALTLPAGVKRVEAFEVYFGEQLRQLAVLPFESPRQRMIARGQLLTPQDIPLVSVLIRSAGRQSLQRALESVLAQTYGHIEIVLIDVQGTGLTTAQQTLSELPLRLASTGKQLTRSAAANLGLAQARGDYLIFLDDDDWFYPDHLAKLVLGARQRPDVKAIHTVVECVDDMGRPSGVEFDFAYAPRELCYGNFMPIHSVLFHRTIVDAGCEFDHSFDLYEDWDFWLQVELQTSFAFVPGVSAAYRVNAASGAGVHVALQQAQQATARLYAKWQVIRAESTFQELISRSLSRRQLQAQLAVCHRLALQRDAEMSRLATLAESQQSIAAQAENVANLARQDAHHLRLAHDTACHDRDMAAGKRDEAIAQAANERTQFNQAMETMAQIRYEAAHQSAEAQRAHALAFQYAQTAEQLAIQVGSLQQSIGALHSSTSWRVTQPLRQLATPVRKTKSVWLAYVAARSRGLRATHLLRRTLLVFRREGLAGVRQRIGLLRAPMGHPPPAQLERGIARNYQSWVAQFDVLTEAQLTALRQTAQKLAHQPLISIVMPVYNPAHDDLQRAIDSVRAQVYPNWQLCICDDASTAAHVGILLQSLVDEDARICVKRLSSNSHISAASNAAIEMAQGDYVAFLDHDDVLRPHALLLVMQTLLAQPSLQILYSDEDKIDATGQRFDPYFKPDFNLGLLRSHNYMCHFAVYKTQLLRTLGGLRVGFEGAQDYDLALRAVDALPKDRIGHISQVLYHWRTAEGSTAAGHTEKSYAFEAGRHALAEHLSRRGLSGEVLGAPEAPGMYRVRWTIPAQAPLVSIIIPTRNGEPILRLCLDSLRQTSYRNYEVIVVDNGSDDPATLAILAEREAYGQIRVLRDDQPFNFSAINNRAVNDMARGEFVVLMNNDVEIMHSDWLAEMVGPALEAGVGCIGARLWYPDDRLQHAGIILVCGVAGHAHKYFARGQHGYMGRAVLAQDMIGVTAACMLVRKSIYVQVGGLDETLAVAFNDVDFCLRVHSAGYRNHWTPYAELVHHESVTRGYEDTPEKQQRFQTEIITMQKRWADLLSYDPCYNPNLTIEAEDFSLAWPPRRIQT